MKETDPYGDPLREDRFNNEVKTESGFPVDNYFIDFVNKLREVAKSEPEEAYMVYLICPVRNASIEATEELERYVRKLERAGRNVHFPPRDVNQSCETGINICRAHLDAIHQADEVHIFWDVNSKGSHFDLGMAFALRKPLRLIRTYHPDNDGKSYLKVIKELENADTADIPKKD